MKSCLVIGYMHANLGDDLFFKILFERYKNVTFYIFPPSLLLDRYKKIFKHNKNVVFYDTDPYYLKIRDEINDDTIPINLFQMVLKKAKEVDFCINFGGSIFIQSPEWRKDDRFKIKAALGKKPSFIIGCNFGPGDKEFHDYYEKWFKKFDDICFRDKKSYNQFKNLNNIRLADDIALLETNNRKRIFLNKKTIGISIVNASNYKNLKNYKRDYQNFIIKLINKYQKENFKITLFSFCKEEGDLIAINEILEKIKDTKNIRVVSYEGDISSFINEWKKNRYIVAARLHSIVLALKYHQAFIPLSYSDKTKSFLHDIDSNIRVVDINKIKGINANRINFIEITKEYNSEEQFTKIDKYLRGE